MAEIKQSDLTQKHSLQMCNRSNMKITGVNDVSEFSDDAVKLKTSMGSMLIKGNNMSISKLDTDNGEVEINGSINMILYQEKQKSGFLSGLLK